MLEFVFSLFPNIFGTSKRDFREAMKVCFAWLKQELITGKSTVQEALTCVAKEMFFNAVEMPPHQWRTTVRALLRVDIYGHEQGGFKHKGLKDLVTEMQIRQRARHDLLDAHVAAGGTLGHGLFGQNCNNGGITNGSAGSMHAGAMHTCLQILNIAKLAIDNLVIA